MWKPMYRHKFPAHEFPTHGLCRNDPRSSRLRSLTIGGCVLPPRIHEFAALTKLVLHGMADSTPYEGVITSCLQLKVLHLKSCLVELGKCLVVDAPMSEIKELVIDDCRIKALKMRALPKLERISTWGTRLLFESNTYFPFLRQFHLAYNYGHGRKMHPIFIDDLTLESFFNCSSTPEITNLIIRFTGPERWIMPSCLPSTSYLLPGLRRLLVADVPSFWDVSWPRILLDAAPLLRSLHIHIAPCVDEPDDVEIPWQPADVLLHHRLEEFAMAGFEGTERQVYFVKFVVGACTALHNVAIFKGGNVQYKGFWDWEMPRMQENSWTCEEEETMKKQIMDCASSDSADQLKVVLG